MTKKEVLNKVATGIGIIGGMAFALFLAENLRAIDQENRENSPWLVLRQEQAFLPSGGSRTITFLKDKRPGKCYIDSKISFGNPSMSPIDCP